MNVNSIRSKVEKKVAAKKAKIASKCGKVAKAVAIAALFILTGCVISGCATSQADSPTAQRAQSCTVKEVAMTFNIGSQKVEAASPIPGAITFNMEFGTAAQSNEAGGNETMTATSSATQTPTNDIKTDIQAHYNDAIAAASTASKSVLGKVGDGITAVLDLMASKKSGTVPVTLKDGSAATVKCENGQCAIESSDDCPDCHE